MAVNLREEKIGSIRWIVVAGPRFEIFRALGEHMRTEIADVLGDLPSLAGPRAWAGTDAGGRRLAAVRHATETGTPREWAELVALAEGADQPLDTLALLNFRGDPAR